MTTQARKRVFTAKPDKSRKRGEQKKAVSFRAPVDVIEWLARMVADNYDKTQVLIDCVRLGRDVRERFGDRWFEVEYRAKRDKVEVGTELADLALAAVATEIQAPLKTKK